MCNTTCVYATWLMYRNPYIERLSLQCVDRTYRYIDIEICAVSYVRHDSFICATWLVRMNAYIERLSIQCVDCTYGYIEKEMTAPIYIYRYRDLCNIIWTTWLSHMCDVTQSYVWHMCDMTHSYECIHIHSIEAYYLLLRAYISIQCLHEWMHMGDMTHSYVRRDSCIWMQVHSLHIV